MTQAAVLLDHIRSAPEGMTYGELQDKHVSTSPQKRLEESAHRYLRPGEQLIRRKGSDGLVRFVVERVGGLS